MNGGTMTTLENQKTGERTEHANLTAAKHQARSIRRKNAEHDRFVIYSGDSVYLAKPGTQPRGRQSRGGVKVDEMPLEWRVLELNTEL